MRRWEELIGLAAVQTKDSGSLMMEKKTVEKVD